MGKSKAATTKKEVKRYDWDALLNGKTHVLIKGDDFTGTVRAAAAMVRYRARQRGAQVTAEVVDDKSIRIVQGDPNAKVRTSNGAAPKKAKAKAKPKVKKVKAKAKAAKPKPARVRAAQAPTPPPPPTARGPEEQEGAPLPPPAPSTSPATAS